LGEHFFCNKKWSLFWESKKTYLLKIDKVSGRERAAAFMASATQDFVQILRQLVFVGAAEKIKAQTATNGAVIRGIATTTQISVKEGRIESEGFD
jgi:hypothetical protein